MTFVFKTTRISIVRRDKEQKPHRSTNTKQEDKTMARKLINAYFKVSLTKLFVGFVIAMAVMLSISVNANATPNHMTTPKGKTRTAYAVVIDVSVKDNMTYIKTGDGNVWSFVCDDSDVGDVYKITFDTRNTKKKTDDRIVAVHYIGYVFNVKNA